jgi:hypothetical protein
MNWFSASYICRQEPRDRPTAFVIGDLRIPFELE